VALRLLYLESRNAQPKETQVPQSTARRSAPPTEKREAPGERDTLEAIDRDFLRDQIEALLASPALSRVADRHSEGHDNPSDFERVGERDSARELDLDAERDTEPSVDSRHVREALRAGLK
jgi:hypothetical protein